MTLLRTCLLLALIPVFQAAMVVVLLTYNSSPHSWIPGLLALPVPFTGYMLLWYKISLFARWQRTLRAVVLALGTFVLTMGAYASFMIGGISLDHANKRSDSTQGHPVVCGCRVTNWTKYSPLGDRFSVSMPGPPIMTLTTNASAVGPCLDYSFISTPSRSASFLVRLTEFPINSEIKDKSQYFEKSLNSIRASAGKLLSESSIKLHGYEGRQWRYEDPKRKEMITMRMFLVKHQLYILASSIATHRNCPRHTREFLNSFDLNPTGDSRSDSVPNEEQIVCQPFE